MRSCRPFSSIQVYMDSTASHVEKFMNLIVFVNHSLSPSLNHNWVRVGGNVRQWLGIDKSFVCVIGSVRLALERPLCA